MCGQEKTFPNLSYHAGTAISTGLRPRITAWALKNLMQSTHIYRVSGVAGYKRKKYAAYGKGRAEFPEPDFACRSFRAIGILLGSAFPKPCCTQPLLRRHHTKIGSKQQQRAPQNRAHPATTPVEKPISTIARMCMGGQAQAAPARLVCPKARRAAAVNGAKRSS